MIISLSEPSIPTKGCEWPWWGFCRDDGPGRSLRAGFFSTWLIWLVVPDDEDQTFAAGDIDHSLGGMCWCFSTQFPWLGSLNGDLNSQVPKVPPPSLHSCNVKSVPRCSTRAHTCVQAWTMQHFCRVISVPKTESLWYDILYWRISLYFLFVYCYTFHIVCMNQDYIRAANISLKLPFDHLSFYVSSTQ